METVTSAATEYPRVPTTPREQAALLRRRARQALNGHSRGISHRLSLTLAFIITLTVAMGLYLLCALIYELCCLYADESVLSPELADVATNLLFALLCLLLVLPLLGGTFRLACLMTSHADCEHASSPILSALFYPFTSPRAYGRTIAVSLEALGWALASLPLPILVFTLLRRFLLDSFTPPLRGLLTVACLAVCLALGAAVFLLSGLRAGFGGFVFLHEELSLREADRLYRHARRGILVPLFWRLSLLLWVAISVVAVLIPFIPHTFPYSFFCSAVYARSLERE